MRKLTSSVFTSSAAVLLFLVLLFSDCLYYADMLICDGLYRKTENQSREIKIIAIDEKTEQAYGKYSDWSREKSAELTELLFADPDTAPAVLAFDIMFVGDSDPLIDQRLAAACEKAGSVVCASNLIYKGAFEVGSDGKTYYNASAIEREEKPYALLAEVTRSGFANTCISEDNIVRYAQFYADGNGERFYSFAYTAYIAYAEKMGMKIKEPVTKNGQSSFFYSGMPGDVPHVSLSDVLEGTIPLSEFEDCLVLVGVYAPGFQDAYTSSVSRGRQMYGVEINANIVQALLRGKLALPIPIGLYAVFSALMLAVWVFFFTNQRMWIVIGEGAGLIALHLFIGRMAAGKGLLFPQIYWITVILFGIVYLIIQKYVMERVKRRHTLQTLKKYVAPQIVDKLSKDGHFELRLGGEKRHIAVLFVDVRGFTSMSEVLAPEEVVSILNEYLSVTTQAVFANEGTLDKFIGDAVMAIFNAPFAQEDYLFKAVKTAWDIREGVDALAKTLEERCHRTFHVGVGVNCGEAVVGNIGCDFRMDYTAIGDTVNTAARLESNAPAGTILISKAVYDALSNRITADAMGELSLKGKQEKVPVYRVTGLQTLQKGEMPQ